MVRSHNWMLSVSLCLCLSLVFGTDPDSDPESEESAAPMVNTDVDMAALEKETIRYEMRYRNLVDVDEEEKMKWEREHNKALPGPDYLIKRMNERIAKVEAINDKLAQEAAARLRPSFQLTSADIILDNDGALHPLCTCHGEGRSPSLTWINPPAGSKYYSLVMDEVTPGPAQNQVMWMVTNIPAWRTWMIQGASKLPTSNPPGNATFPKVAAIPEGAIEVVPYSAPCPREPSIHRYRIRVFALRSAVSQSVQHLYNTSLPMGDQASSSDVVTQYFTSNLIASTEMLTFFISKAPPNLKSFTSFAKDGAIKTGAQSLGSK